MVTECVSAFPFPPSLSQNELFLEQLHSAEPFARNAGEAEMKGRRGLHPDEIYNLGVRRSEEKQFKVTVAQSEPRVREVTSQVC